MPELLQIPLNVGATEHTDPKLFPAGALKRVENLRLRKDNRLGKRFGYAKTTFQDHDGGTPLDGVQLRGLYEADGAGRIIGGRAVYDYDGVTGLVRALDGQISDYDGVFETSIYHDERTEQRSPGLADAGSYWVATWTSYAASASSGTLFVALIEKTSGRVALLEQVATDAVSGRVAAPPAQTPAVFWVDADDDMHAALVDASGVGTPVTLASADVHTSGAFDVAAGTAGFCLAYHATGGTIQVLFVNAALSILDDESIARSGNPGVVADASDGKFYVLDNTTGTVRVTVFNLTGGAALASADLDTSGDAEGRPSGVVLTSGQIRAVWNGTSANNNAWIKTRDVDAAGNLQAPTTTYGAALASKPWVHGGTVRAWTYPDAGVGEEIRIYTEQRVDSAILNPHGAYAARGFATGSGIASVANDGTALLPVYLRGPLGGQSVRLVALRSASAEVTPWVVPAVTWQGVTYYAGGVLSQTDRVAAGLVGFLAPPVITGRVDSAGALTGEYLWCAIWERLDSSGKVHRSAPSAVNGPGTLSSERATLSFVPHAFDNWSQLAPAGSVALRVFRTLAGGTVFYESTSTFAPPLAADASSDATLSYEDNVTDTNIADEAVLYTQVGNSLPHAAPPSARFLAYHNDRLWAALPGGVLWASKVLVEDEPPQWADDLAFQVRLPAECTALASLDTALVAFTEDAIFAIGGDGPDDAGEGAFLEPQRIPSDAGARGPDVTANGAVGVIGAVAVAAEGIYFSSQRGICLLPRGGGAPVWVGEAVRDQTDARPYIGGAMVVPDENLVSFVVSDAPNFVDGTSRVLNFDYRAGQWFVDTTPINAMAWCAQWMGLPRFWSFDDAALYSRSGGYADNDGNGDTSVPSVLETGDLTPFGPLGWGRVSKIVVLGEYRGDCELSLELSYDGGLTWTTPVTWELRAVDGLTQGDEIRRELVPARWKTEKLRVRLSDDQLAGGSATEGFVYNALALEVELVRGSLRQQSGNRR